MALNTALIIDDSKLARVTLRKKILAHGLSVELAESAAQAYEMLPDLNPDIIFMDHLMPEVSGFEATRHIRQMPGFEHTPIIMCSGKEHDGYLEEALAIGANHVLSKPPVDEELDAVLAELALALSSTTEVSTDVEQVTEIACDAASRPQDALPAELIESESIDEAPVQSVMAASMVDIEAVCREVFEEQKSGLFSGLQQRISATVGESVTEAMAQTVDQVVTQVLQQIDIPVAEAPTAFDMTTIEELCRSVVAKEKTAIISEIKSSLPEPEVSIPVIQSPEIDIAMVKGIVDDVLMAHLPGLLENMKAELVGKLNEQIIEELDKQRNASLDQDLQGIMDLRINVMLAEKFAEVDDKFEQMEQTLSEQMSVLKASSEVMALDSDLVLEKGIPLEKGINKEFVASKGIESQLDQMIERQTQLTKTLQVAKMIAIGSVILSLGAAIGVASFYLS